MDETTLPDIDIELVKFSERKNRLLVGTGRLTKSGKGYALKIKQSLKAGDQVYVFPKKTQPKRQKEEKEPLWAWQEYKLDDEDNV